MNMRNLAACFGVAATLVAWASPIHAQIETSVQTEPAAKSEPAAPAPSANIEPSAKLEPPPQTAPSIDAFIAKLDSGTRAIHASSKKDTALMREGCRVLLNEILDLDTMARATNVEIWEQMTAIQRETIRVAFELRMIGNCVRQFNGYEGELLQLAGVRPTEGGDMLATIRIGAQLDGKLVTWRLRGSGQDIWRAVDVISEGRSAVSDAHNEFAAVLQSVNGDIEALIAFMQK